MIKLPLPPGPRGNTLTGSLFEARGRLLDFMRDVAAEHGDVSMFRLLHVRCVLVNHPDLIGQVLSQFSAKSWDVRQLRVHFGRGLVTSEGKLWRRQRRHAQPAFDRQNIERYVGTFVAETESLLAEWGERNELDIHQQMMRLALWIIAKTMFNASIRGDSIVVEQALSSLTAEIESVLNGRVPLPLQVPTPRRVVCRVRIRRLHRLFRRYVREHLAAADPPHDLLTQLLTARSRRGRPIRRRQIRDEFITVLLAGHETIAIALSWCFRLLAQHPDVERRLLEELETVIGDGTVESDHLAQLPIMRAVLQETMRLHPPAWGTGRRSTHEFELGGFRIPKNTELYCCQAIMQRDPRYFEDPHSFQPERWLGDFHRRLPRHAFFPFGGGQRVCIGAHFAMDEMAAIVATVLRRFRFEVADERPIVEEAGVTLRPRNGIRLVATRR